jgi:predicted HicB family RNase H-like nuclease
MLQAVLNIRHKPSDKKLWEAAAIQKQITLSEWIRETLSTQARIDLEMPRTAVQDAQ